MRELVELRTPKAKHFDLGGGQRMAIITAHDQHYFDRDTKQCEEVQEHILYDPLGSFTHHFRESAIRSRFGPGKVRIGLAISRFVDFELGSNVAPEVNGATCLYRDILPQVDIQYTVSWNWVKQDIILKGPGHPNTLTFGYGPGYVTLTPSGGAVTISDGNAVLGTIPAPVAVDATGKSIPVAWQIGSSTLEVTLDPAWLEQAVYPVTVDPTVVLQPGAEGKDTFIDEGYPTSNRGNMTDLWCGFSDADEGTGSQYGQQYSLIQFDLSSIPSGSAISSAELGLYIYQLGTGGSPSGRLYRVTSSWAETSVTWNTRPTYDSATILAAYSNPPTGWLLMSTAALAQVVQNWVNGTYPNYGLELYNTSPFVAGNYNGIFLYSSDYSVANYRPKLTITYTTGTLVTVTADTLRRVKALVTPAADTNRRVKAQASAACDTRRRVSNFVSLMVDTRRQVSSVVQVIADTLRIVEVASYTVQVAVDTLRRVAATTSVTADTLRRVIDSLPAESKTSLSLLPALRAIRSALVRISGIAMSHHKRNV
jgi:hypothetical protein